MTAPPPSNRRIAGAPISWGVCEVPGWGFQLAAERVFSEMRELGIGATELGPQGYLPADPAERVAFLERFGLQAVGGFVPVLLHDEEHDPLPDVDVAIDAGAGTIVLAASTGLVGYDLRPTLDDAQWSVLLTNLDRLADHAVTRGCVAVIHPHIGTMVENADDVQRVLDGSRISLCVDTGHLVAAGADPVAITRAHTDRVGHVHLKDVDAALAADVVAGRTSFSDAVAAGLWKVLGEGSVDVLAMISALEGAGYQGWYVLEQDRMLTDGEPEGAGPITDVRACLDYVRTALAAATPR